MNTKLQHGIFPGALFLAWGVLAIGSLFAADADSKLPLYGKMRTWTVVGNSTVAKMVSAGDDWVTLESQDGTSKRHGLGFTSQADQAFVRSFLELRLKQAPAKYHKSRRWTDRNGKLLGEGPISSASEKDLYIRKDGKPQGLFFPFLCDEDKQFIADFLKESPSNPAEYGSPVDNSKSKLGPRDFRAMKAALKEEYGKLRIWTDITGQFQTRATLHSASEIEVRLVLANGRGLTLKRAKLAEADRQLLDEYLTKWTTTPDASPEDAPSSLPSNPFEQLPTSIRLADGLSPEKELHEYGQRRVWKDDTGLNFIEAHMLAANKQTVQLKLENLRYINVPINRLDPADRKLVDEFVIQAEKQAKELAEKMATTQLPKTNGTNPTTEATIDTRELALTERTADFSRVKLLVASKIPMWNVPVLSSIPPLQQAPQAVTIGLKKCDNVRMATQNSVTLACHTSWPPRTRLVVCKPSPADQIAYDLAGTWRLKHVSPDGTSAVLAFDKHSECRVAIVDIHGATIVSRFQFVAERGANQTLERAFLLSRDRLVTVLFKNIVTLWDLSPETGPVALSRYEPSGTEFNSKHFAVAPGGEVFALKSSQGYLLVDREKGEVVGTISKPRMNWGTIGFSSDGRHIAVSDGKLIQIFDSRSGSKVSDIPSIHSLVDRIVWPDEDHLLVDGILYSLKLKLPVCSYVEKDQLNIGHGRYFPITHTNFDAKTTSLRFVKLPDATALQHASTMKTSDGFAVYPGCKVRLVIQLVDGSESARLREIIIRELKQTLEKNDWHIADDAPTTILVRVEGFTITRTLTVKQSTVGGVVNTLKGLFGNSENELGEQVTIDCKGLKHSIELKHGDVPLLSHQHLVFPPDKFDVRINESVKEASERAVKPAPKWFSTVKLDNPIRIPTRNVMLPSIALFNLN